MAGGPLEGVRVIDLTSVVVGPLATQILADHGAEVIKVESRAGDLVRIMNGRSVTPAMGAKFLHLNRNKRSIVLDLKQAAGHAALLQLLQGADVMLWNNRPQSMARMRLSYDDVRAVNPRIIYCGMFGFGQDGRYRDKPAYDTIIQGAGGMAALNERAGGEPRYVPMVVADKAVGLIAVQMIVMALYRRTQTGEGCAMSTCTSRPSSRRWEKPAIRGCSTRATGRYPRRTATSASRPTPTSRRLRSSTPSDGRS
jgi:crotonobetainyl-CoA:carnitine CoA-transferase CaiB-like acyl-CoA transferase